VESSAFDQLGAIAHAVAVAMQNQAQCIAGVALLCSVAEHFNLELTPRAVSMAGYMPERPETTQLATGGIARQFVIDHGGSGEIGGVLGAAPDGSEFQRAGHLIATLKEPALLVDPTFGQFVRAGWPDLVPVAAFDPSAERWELRSDERVRAFYLFDDTNRGWQESYEVFKTQFSGLAARVANHLESGAAPHAHGLRVRFPG
jgi:hypothetical protein